MSQNDIIFKITVSSVVLFLFGVSEPSKLSSITKVLRMNLFVDVMRASSRNAKARCSISFSVPSVKGAFG